MRVALSLAAAAAVAMATPYCKLLPGEDLYRLLHTPRTIRFRCFDEADALSYENPNSNSGENPNSNLEQSSDSDIGYSPSSGSESDTHYVPFTGYAIVHCRLGAPGDKDFVQFDQFKVDVEDGEAIVLLSPRYGSIPMHYANTFMSCLIKPVPFFGVSGETLFFWVLLIESDLSSSEDY